MEKPLVTVVIPIFNTENYLDECISSVVNQTYKNLQIILVDDGSKDNSPAICDKWAKADERIKVIHKENEGAGMARNTGISSAQGKYIFFFDSDDYVELCTVEKCVASAVLNKSEVVAFGRYNFKENGEIKADNIKLQKKFFKESEIKEDFLPNLFNYGYGFGISACSKMFDLELINKHNIRFKSEREILSEDAYFILELFTKIKKLSVVAKPLYYYRENENSFSHSFNPEKQEKNDIFLTKCLELCKKEGLPEKLISHIKARYHIYSLAAMKDILSSDLSKSEKERELLKIFNNPILKSTITKDVLSFESKNKKIFFSLLKNNRLLLCRKMLQYKIG